MGDKYHIKEGIHKFPSFHYKVLNDIILSPEVFPKETTINSLKTLKNLLEQIEKEIGNLVETNLNNFNTQTGQYYRRTYYYKILSQINVLFSEAILSKLEPKKDEEFKFDKNGFIQELKTKYGINSDFEYKIGKLNILFEVFLIII